MLRGATIEGYHALLVNFMDELRQNVWHRLIRLKLFHTSLAAVQSRSLMLTVLCLIWIEVNKVAASSYGNCRAKTKKTNQTEVRHV